MRILSGDYAHFPLSRRSMIPSFKTKALGPGGSQCASKITSTALQQQRQRYLLEGDKIHKLALIHCPLLRAMIHLKQYWLF
jgi:hypothetical protein